MVISHYFHLYGGRLKPADFPHHFSCSYVVHHELHVVMVGMFLL